jgi:hypothetical protein
MLPQLVHQDIAMRDGLCTWQSMHYSAIPAKTMAIFRIYIHPEFQIELVEFNIVLPFDLYKGDPLAQPSVLYRFHINFSDIDQGIYKYLGHFTA